VNGLEKNLNVFCSTIALLGLLFMCGCSTARDPIDYSIVNDQNNWMAERREQLKEAVARARAAEDNRPYPDGWPVNTLPLNRDPSAAQPIHLGNTMSEVTKLMGREGWGRQISQQEFLAILRKTYGQRSSPDRLPQELSVIEKRLSRDGRFVYWEYQGFPTTADWIVVFFASSEKAPEFEPRVVSRGVFRLGDY